jgi:MoxR-like ATPase
MTGISFKQFGIVAPHIIKSRKPIMGHGKHGIGKSELVYQLAPQAVHILGLADKYGDDYVFPVVERRASQMADVGDVIGVPEPETTEHGRVTKFAPMTWFAQACSQPCILFFDEVDRANNDVRQSLMELTDSRKIAGHNLHPDTIVIAMVNGGTHDTNNSYQVSELDPAEHDRWWHVDLEPTVEDWISWANDNCHPMTVDFIRNTRFILLVVLGRTSISAYKWLN